MQRDAVTAAQSRFLAKVRYSKSIVKSASILTERGRQTLFPNDEFFQTASLFNLSPDKLHQLLTRVFAIDFDNFQLGASVPFQTVQTLVLAILLTLRAHGMDAENTACAVGISLQPNQLSTSIQTTLWNQVPA